MPRARRTLDRRTLREQGEAAERQKKSKGDAVEEKDEEEEEDEEEPEEEAAAGEEEAGEDDEDAKPKKKKAVAKKKAPAKPKTTKPRSKAKIVRMKLVWVVYSNSHQPLEEFPYPKKSEAESYLAKITNDKKSGGPFFLQPLKKPMDKEKE